MKKIALTAIALLAATGLAWAAAEKKFGKEITLKETTKISAITAAPDDFSDKRVLVEGTIVDVCAKRGCGVKIASDKEHESLMFKVQDGVMVFPMETKGKQIRAEGVIAVKRVEKKAEGDAKKAESGAHAGAECKGCCATVIMMKGEGAVVFDAPVKQ